MSDKILEYKVNKHNSTVCGYPGRDFDWSKFCWDGSAEYTEDLYHLVQRMSPRIAISRNAPLPLIDDFLIGKGNQYLHVPYDWQEQGTIYRVRPNEAMQAGHIYRGYNVIRTEAIKKDEVWYWRLTVTKDAKHKAPLA